MAVLSFCGIDVAKDRLDVMVLPEQQSFAVRNDAAGWAELIARLRGLAIAAIGLEATGGYERGRCELCWQPACRRARSIRSS
jgi:transposase